MSQVSNMNKYEAKLRAGRGATYGVFWAENDYEARVASDLIFGAENVISFKKLGESQCSDVDEVASRVMLDMANREFFGEILKQARKRGEQLKEGHTTSAYFGTRYAVTRLPDGAYLRYRDKRNYYMRIEEVASSYVTGIKPKVMSEVDVQFEPDKKNGEI